MENDAVIFPDFSGLENGLPKFHDFPCMTSGHPADQQILNKK